MYSRIIDDQILTLAPSGWTYKRTFVLYDKETGTLWYPDDKGLMGIQGHYFKRRLPRIDAKDTQWGEWVDRHPQSKVLR